MRIVVRGAVQGVGFRPFVYRLASELGLSGWVKNTEGGVLVEVEGPPERLDRFLVRIPRDKPAVATIHGIEPTLLDPVGYASFEIAASARTGGAEGVTAPILPDIATCPECLREMFDPADRRYRYPFINCTHCGPRFSIVEALPYDRPNTTMKAFSMCARCAAEYEDPGDRRFHAQPNACPECGPHVEWWDNRGKSLASHEDALSAAVDAIRAGRVVAVKGLGGFHLVTDARNERAVRRLRERKHRDEKPFAVMVPSLPPAGEGGDVEAGEVEAFLLRSPEAPIVLVRRAPSSRIAPAVAPGNPWLGVMLPYAPLHHLLMADLRFPVVATSGNVAEEPICTREDEALERLGGIADAFLVHNRPIARHVDDSVVRVVAGRVLVLRRARGYAPLPVAMPELAAAGGADMLAVGGHLKNTAAITRGGQIFASQHVGDMSTAAAFDALRRVVEDFRRLYRFEPRRIACDLHPDYTTTRYAARLAADFHPALAVTAVQHHLAHVMACAAENEVTGPVLGVSWDGTGYGTDGTVWGGEFLRVEGGEFRRVAHLATFRLPGGDRAVREPRRSAAGMLYELLGENALARRDLPPFAAFAEGEIGPLETMLRRGVNAPPTSSAGRLFDAVASLLGIRQQNHYEGQAAMELEFCTEGIETAERYPFDIVSPASGPAVLDWHPMVRAIMRDAEACVATGVIATRFHNTLAEAIASVARIVGEERVVLTGGCFQNKYLTETTVDRLEAGGFKPYWHQRVPPNDGGLALGQLAAVAALQPRGE
jgi:hydrogenase maturation protein HypF